MMANITNLESEQPHLECQLFPLINFIVYMKSVYSTVVIVRIKIMHVTGIAKVLEPSKEYSKSLLLIYYLCCYY